MWSLFFAKILQFYKEVQEELSREREPHPDSIKGQVQSFFGRLKVRYAVLQRWHAGFSFFLGPLVKLFWFRRVVRSIFNKFFKALFALSFLRKLLSFFERTAFFLIFLFFASSALYAYAGFSTPKFGVKILWIIFTISLFTLFFLWLNYRFAPTLVKLNVSLFYFLFFLFFFSLFFFDIPGVVFEPSHAPMLVLWFFFLSVSSLYVQEILGPLFPSEDPLKQSLDHCHKIVFFWNYGILVLVFPWLLFRFYGLTYLQIDPLAFDLFSSYRLGTSFSLTFSVLLFHLWVTFSDREQREVEQAAEQLQAQAKAWALLPRDERRKTGLLRANVWLLQSGLFGGLWVLQWWTPFVGLTSFIYFQRLFFLLFCTSGPAPVFLLDVIFFSHLQCYLTVLFCVFLQGFFVCWRFAQREQQYKRWKAQKKNNLFMWEELKKNVQRITSSPSIFFRTTRRVLTGSLTGWGLYSIYRHGAEEFASQKEAVESTQISLSVQEKELYRQLNPTLTEDQMRILKYKEYTLLREASAEKLRQQYFGSKPPVDPL